MPQPSDRTSGTDDMDAVSGTTAQTGVTPSAAATWKGIAGGGGGVTDLFIDASKFQIASPNFSSANGFVYQTINGFTNTNMYVSLMLPSDWVTFDAKVVWFLTGTDTTDAMMWRLNDRFVAVGDALTFNWPGTPNHAEVGDIPPAANQLMETDLFAAPVANQPGQYYCTQLVCRGQDGNGDPKGFVGLHLVKVS